MPEQHASWRPVPGWPAYEVADGGAVRSVPRVLSDGREHGGQVLRPRRDRDGYVAVTLAQGRRRRTVRVHVLVMRAFGPPQPPGKPQVRHLNGDKSDNWSANLAWGDQADQEADKARAAGRAVDRARQGLGISLRRRDDLELELAENRNRKKEDSHTDRALAIGASPASRRPHAPLRPGQTPVSSQVATGAETGPATAAGGPG